MLHLRGECDEIEKTIISLYFTPSDVRLLRIAAFHFTDSGIIVFIYIWIVFQAKKHFKSDKILQHKQTYEISDAGIIIESISGNWKVQWEEVLKVIESREIIAIYVGRIRALILPKEVIRTQRNDGLHIVMGIFTRNLSKSKVKFVSKSGGH